jgi:type IV pilus assembly protein PilQ
VLDWKGVTNLPEKRSLSWDAGSGRSVEHFQANNQLRAIINLEGFAEVNVSQSGDKTELSLSRKMTEKVSEVSGPFKNVNTTKRPLIQEKDMVSPIKSAFIEKNDQGAGLSKLGLTDVKMQRQSDGSVKMIYQLDSEKATADVKMDGQKLVVRLPSVRAVDVLNKYTDTRGLSSLVQGYDIKNQESGVVSVLEMRGNWTYSSYQTNQQLVVEVKQQKEEVLSVGGDVKSFKGQKLSMNFQNLDVRAVLQLLAEYSGQNIVVSDSVQGTIALRLKDVPWDQALDLVLDAKGLSMVQRNNVIWVAPRQEIQQKEQQEAERELQKVEQLPLRTASYQLNYQRAEQVKDLLSNKDQRILSKRGAVSVDARTNTVFVNDVSPKLEEVSNLIKKIDVPMRQVLIEARIVEASDTFAKELGAKVGYTESNARGGDINSRINSPSLSNLPASGINGAAAGNLAFMLFNPSATRILNVELSALISDGNGKIVSSPRVVTADQMEATIEQGTEIPYQKSTSSGATSIEFKKAVMSLNVKPQITPEGKVILDLKVNKDSIGVTTLSGPSIDTKKVNTQVLVENGGTVAIGGIVAEEDRTTVTKVPFFGDIPIIGYLFRQTSKSSSKKELIVLITPKIVMEDGTLVKGLQ